MSQAKPATDPDSDLSWALSCPVLFNLRDDLDARGFL
jgi:hypothetical protein